MADDKRGGDGKTSPFGNGKGATMSGSTGARDFTKEPGRPGEGGNDFLKNPGGNAARSGGKDFSKEQAPAQKDRTPEADSTSPDGSPAPGERFPHHDAMSPDNGDVGCGSIGKGKKPFRLK